MAELPPGQLPTSEKRIPIPTSPAVYWRSFRLHGLPVVVFPGALAPVIPQWRKFATHTCPIGAQVEAITTSRAFVRPGLLADAGLPIVVEVPEEAASRPGAIVDLLFLPETLNGAEPPRPAPSPRPGLSPVA